MGGSQRGGVSSEVGIPEQKNTQQKKGLPLFRQSHAYTSVHGGYMGVHALIGFIDSRDKVVSSAFVCWRASAAKYQPAASFFISA